MTHLWSLVNSYRKLILTEVVTDTSVSGHHGGRGCFLDYALLGEYSEVRFS